MAGTFAAVEPPLFQQPFHHIAIAHLGTLKGNAKFRKALFQREIGHQRAHDPRFLTHRLNAFSRHDIQKRVAVVDVALAVGHDQAIGVTVKRQPQIGTGLGSAFGKIVGVRRADASVDVKAVGLDAVGDNVGTEFVEHGRRRMIGRTVSAVEVKLHSLEVKPRREGALAELNVTPAGVVQTIGLAERIACYTLITLGDFGFDFFLYGIGQFRPVG